MIEKPWTESEKDHQFLADIMNLRSNLHAVFEAFYFLEVRDQVSAERYCPFEGDELPQIDRWCRSAARRLLDPSSKAWWPRKFRRSPRNPHTPHRFRVHPDISNLRPDHRRLVHAVTRVLVSLRDLDDGWHCFDGPKRTAASVGWPFKLPIDELDARILAWQNGLVENFPAQPVQNALHNPL